MNQTLISIIVPVYNCEKYLHKCLNTILNQDYTNFELLLINDGSTDNSLIICNEYKEKDSRIHVYSKENGGVSLARNLGLDNAQGEYIVFIDSDDYVGSSYLSSLIQYAEEDTFVLTDYQPFTEDGYEKREYGSSYTIDFNLNKESPELFKRLIFNFQIFPPYCKLYKKSLIEKNYLRFNEKLKSAEDFDFNIRYLKEVKILRYEPIVRYYYRVGYKSYIPSNRGILGDSEIQSVHIMSKGIVELAERMGVYNDVENDIALWAANKHYFNRLRMLFRKNKEIGFNERAELYKKLTDNNAYKSLYKKGISFLPKSTTKTIASYMDYYLIWWLFYRNREVR